jgi:hypothetical protein
VSGEGVVNVEEDAQKILGNMGGEVLYRNHFGAPDQAV